MSGIENFVIDAHWQRRGESPKALAARLRRYADLARPALPVDLAWYLGGENLPDDVLAPSNDIKLQKLIADGAADDEDTNAYPHFGYRIIFYLAKSDPGLNPSHGSLIRVTGGASKFQNHLIFYTDVTFEIEPTHVS